MEDMCAATVLEKPSLEVIYEGAHERWIGRRAPIRRSRLPAPAAMAAARRCSRRRARPAKATALDRLAADYPRGPHDQPQSMCPAFGSLRVGLRMRRTATILSGSACCVYGLTFTSHFYGAKRTVGYVPFNSETLVRGQLFEDIRNAVFADRQAGGLRRRRGDQSVRADRFRRAAGSAAEGNRRRADHRHRCARLRRADPCRGEGRAGRRHAALCAPGGRSRDRSQRPRQMVEDKPIIALIGELFPADPPGVARDAGADGPGVGAADARRANGATCTRALDCVGRRCDPSVLHRIDPRIRAPPAVPSSAPRPVGVDGTAAWLDAIGKAANVPRRSDRRRQGARAAGDPGRRWPPIRSTPASPSRATKARNCWSRGC